jgi:hypothetical protein
MSQVYHPIAHYLINLVADLNLPFRVKDHSHDEKGSWTSDRDNGSGAEHADRTSRLCLILKE